jgi:hypothetical protein
MRHEDLDAARGTGLASDEALAFEREDHLMDGRWCAAEVLLNIGFGGRSSMEIALAYRTTADPPIEIGAARKVHKHGPASSIPTDVHMRHRPLRNGHRLEHRLTQERCRQTIDAGMGR